MKLTVNKVSLEVKQGSSLSDLVLQVEPTPPFAVAVNMQFVPKSAYASTALCEGDSIEVIRPVTGG